MATAYQKFFAAAESGHLPAAIPIIGRDGDSGIATLVIEVSAEQNTQAMQMMFSENRMQRAAACVYALNYGMREVTRCYEGVVPQHARQ